MRADRDDVAARRPLTVLVPAYNEAGSVGATVRSLIDQTVKPDRIVVIDDCSTDDTAETVSYTHLTLPTTPYV